MSKVIIIGAGLGGLSTALRLSHLGYQVTILEKHAQAGGRLNQLKLGDFTFDLGPSFMSMSYEFKELFASCHLPFPLRLHKLDPLYQVFFEQHRRPYKIWKDPQKFAEEFQGIESNLAPKVEQYLQRACTFFHDTERQVIKSNYEHILDYLLKLSRVPLKHLPYLFKNMWQEAKRHFDSEEIRIIFCLVAFFLGSTPFQTPAVYSLLSYTEFRHDGYWVVEGGMYRLAENLVETLKDQGVHFVFHTEVQQIVQDDDKVTAVIDQDDRQWKADLFVANSDAAAFRGAVLKRKAYSPQKLDRMDWSLAPFTIYLGVQKQIEPLIHHNYCLGSNFHEYANTIFKSSISPKKPYYYVNVPTRWDRHCAPEGSDALFVLCPVPDLRFKKGWDDKDELADHIIQDLSFRTGFDIQKNIVEREVLSPLEWESMFNLYRGSGLGLNHGLNQVGALRPRNKDEQLQNLYYVGASTTPGTGLPMVVISSKLVTERIQKDYGSVSANLV